MMETENQIAPARPRGMARKRDQQVRRLTIRYERLSGTTDPRLRPAFRSLAIISLMLERSYQTLRERESLLNDGGELRASLDTVRRLLSTQKDLLRICGLTAESILSDRGDRSLDAVFERIAKVKSVRERAGNK